MTCIVGLEHDGKVYIGGDSAGVSGYDTVVRADEKVFINEPFIMGFTTSFRMGQILQYCFSPSKQPSNEIDNMKFLVKTFVNEVRDVFKNNGFTPKSDEFGDRGGTFLIGFKGKLYTVESDFQIGKSVNEFAACGCGAQLAMGSLFTSKDLNWTPEKRIEKALETAVKFNAGVSAPFVIKCK